MADSYNAPKEFEGRQYTGMQVGRSHKWYYDKGEWKERKLTPDRWEITYSVIKRRAGKAPEGSGVPVGTGYHWFILSHQFVHKINADDYTTFMTGIKVKLAHQRADKGKWNASNRKQTELLIQALQQMIDDLKKDPAKAGVVALDFSHGNKTYQGMAIPMMDSCEKGRCREFDVILNDKELGIIRHSEKGWRLYQVKPQQFVSAIGAAIEAWYGPGMKASSRRAVRRRPAGAEV